MASVSRLEYAVLDELDRSGDTPIGCGRLWSQVRCCDASVSEPTIGRLLFRLDTLGLTEKVGNRGRVLSEAGRARLQELRSQKERGDYERELLDTFHAGTLEAVLDVLGARRALERETARLAATNATPEQIAEMARSIEGAKAQIDRGELCVAEDRQFHRLIAEAAGNRVLVAALDLIRHDLELQRTMMARWIRAGGQLVAGHRRILAAIQKRDPDEAERVVLENIDGIIADLTAYR